MSDATRDFCELVDCAPADVRDIPAERQGVDSAAEAERLRAAPRRITGRCEMPFGKYRGQLLESVPRSYLEWLVCQPSRGRWRSTKKIKRWIATWLREGDPQ